MGSRKTQPGVERVYRAAQVWVDRALRRDDSLFTPGRPIWTSDRLRELRERFLDNPDETSASFLDKLKGQLEGSPPEAYQLVGEALYFYFLFVSTQNSSTEKSVIDTALGWSPSPAIVPQQLVNALTPGIGSPGVYFHTNRLVQVGFIVEFVEQWKELDSNERERLLGDPWAFKRFVTHLDFRSELLRGHNATNMQEVLFHLVFPDTFEPMVNFSHKERVARAFADLAAEQTEDIDRKLAQIHRGLEAGLGRDIQFYDDPAIRSRWDHNFNPWNEFVRRAKEFVNTIDIDREEIVFKLDIGQKLAEAREAVLTGADDWVDRVRKGLTGNIIHNVQQSRFRAWMNESPDEALSALREIWAQNNSSVSSRVRAFSGLFPTSATGTRGAGTRMNIISVLLMGLDAQRYPPFRVTAFDRAYENTGYDRPEGNADEVALYGHALGFLDRFIEEASERGLNLRHRLDAQSVVWRIQGFHPVPPPPPEPGGPLPILQSLADRLLLPVEFLEKIDTLLDEKKQVIFQGPPGTGKTYVAQELAEHLADAGERVTLVQFHPSYAYEDFVQGFRPTLTRDGQAGFELRNGPLLRAAERAQAEPRARHFLLIDEINRGNLAKLFGELYFLLEYRNKEMNLQYSDETFSLPDNLYIIGTMNTADRSIALVDLALRRRFYFVEFHPDEAPIKGLLSRWLSENAPRMAWVADVVVRVNELLSDDRHAAIGPSYFMKPDLDEAAVRRTWEHGVLPYIEERLFGEGEERLGEFALERLRGANASVDRDADGQAAANAQNQDGGEG